MKRTFLAKRNALLSRAGSRLGLAIFVLVLIVAGVRILFPNFVLATTTPLFRFSDWMSTSTESFTDGFENSTKLSTEVDTLITANATLEQENAVLTAKVADLENVLGNEAPNVPGVLAGVLARPPETAYDTLIVAAGTNDGISSGDVAYATSGLPVGVVTAVSSNAARVTLLSASSEVTDAWVGSARLPITLLGAGGGAFLAQALRSASTSPGDLVYVSGPGALPIGKVAAVSGDPSSPFITLEISGVVDIFSLPYVLIEHAGPSTWPASPPGATSTLP
jgi:cell shape-determining protein MreC